jgi:putative ABC transport system permease protein
MFDLDRWREIFQSISKNKLRSVMSGFTVAFAILLFTLLFGVVNGLSNTFKDVFVDDAMNTIFVRVWKTSKPFKGLQTGRRIQLKNNDYNYINNEYEDKIQHQTARINRSVNIAYKNKQDNYSLRAVHPDHQFLEKTIVYEGRYINKRDLNERAKVIVIGRLIKEDLFGAKPALGKRVNVSGISYQIIGIFSDEGGDNEERLAYMPVTTAQMIY